MKILLVTQYFHPENFKSNDIAFELQKRGHEVTVLTGLPNYPEGKIFEGYGFFKQNKRIINGVKVLRSWLIPRGKGGGIRLFLNYFSFAFFASLKAFFHSLTNKYDAVIVHEPSPITQFYPAWMVKLIRGTPIYFWVLDLWPETLQFVGGIKNKYILSFFTKMVQSFYNRSEKILISSKGFEKSILEKGNYKEKIVFFPNWAEESISEGNTNLEIPTLPEGFRIMFAGNIGECQDMESVMKAALELRNHKEIKWILVGDGRKMPYVKEFVTKNKLEDSVSIMGRFPIEMMASFFDQADLLLVSLRDDEVFNITVPAKVQAYMSVGKPIIGMLNGEGAKNIEEAKCGYAVPASDYKSLALEILKLSNFKKEDLSKLGIYGRNYFLEHYKLDKCITNLELILNKKI